MVVTVVTIVNGVVTLGKINSRLKPGCSVPTKSAVIKSDNKAPNKVGNIPAKNYEMKFALIYIYIYLYIENISVYLLTTSLKRIFNKPTAMQFVMELMGIRKATLEPRPMLYNDRPSLIFISKPFK